MLSFLIVCVATSTLQASVCLCGEAPERADDFFWENDCVGFRAYGPGDAHKWSGIDVFNKNTSSNVVHTWLRRLGPRVKWHKNVKGLGMDDYAVGPGRGVGGVAFRKNGAWLADYGDWTAFRVIMNSDARCAFELDYRLPIGGTMTLAISLARGSSLFREAVSFSADTPLDGVEVGVGLDLNAERLHVGDVFVDEKKGIVSLFEKPHVDKTGKPIKGEEGSTMSALRAIRGYAAMVDEPNGGKMLMTKPLSAADANGCPVLEVWAGADWSEAGRHITPAEWHAYVRGLENAYFDLAQAAVSAYTPAHVAQYLADVEREGVQEHGFPRLAAGLGTLLANGRCLVPRATIKRMLDASCRDAAKGQMPPKSGGNDFSVKELVEAVVALEKAQSFPPETITAWKRDLTAVVAEKCYRYGRLKPGEKRPHNWVVFASASEQSRRAHGLGGSAAFVEKYVADQLRWFDANGMYRDAVVDPPAVYDMVTRLQFAQLLFDGFDGPSRAKLEEMMEKSAEPTLKMLSVSGEMPCGGRSNQFLHNNTFYAALCEWYATWDLQRGNLTRARRFKAAARAAVASLRPWLAETPVLHVKNRYPREEGKAVYSEKGDMGCERYAYFDKYMVTMGTWSLLGHKFAREIPEAAAEGEMIAKTPYAYATTPTFGFYFLAAGDYSAQFLGRANAHYDSVGLARVQRRGAPSAICLSVPCTEKPVYRIETPNDGPLAILPVVGGAATSSMSPYLKLVRCASDSTGACADWIVSDSQRQGEDALATSPSDCGAIAKSGCGARSSCSQTVPGLADGARSVSWNTRLTAEGVTSILTGSGPIALTLPAFAFDGREETRIAATEKTLTIAYRGWKCVYETDGAIVDTGRAACNRNGRYRRFEARASDRLAVRIRIEKQ